MPSQQQAGIGRSFSLHMFHVSWHARANQKREADWPRPASVLGWPWVKIPIVSAVKIPIPAKKDTNMTQMGAPKTPKWGPETSPHIPSSGLRRRDLVLGAGSVMELKPVTNVCIARARAKRIFWSAPLAAPKKPRSVLRQEPLSFFLFPGGSEERCIFVCLGVGGGKPYSCKRISSRALGTLKKFRRSR